MKYMLDTNICIYIINKKPEKVLKKFKKFSLGDVLLSSVTYAELNYGIEKSHHKEKNSVALKEFVMPLDIISFDYLAAEHYGKLRALLESKGTPIGALDLMIAAHAQSMNVTLVTNNVREFSRIPRLPIEDWTQ